jgi:hypothetical protein
LLWLFLAVATLQEVAAKGEEMKALKKRLAGLEQKNSTSW